MRAWPHLRLVSAAHRRTVDLLRPGGFLASPLARRVGGAPAIAAALAVLVVGLGVRVLAGSGLLLLGTLLACAGIAVCNVLVPVVVKESFPNRIGLITGVYSASWPAAAPSPPP